MKFGETTSIYKTAKDIMINGYILM